MLATSLLGKPMTPAFGPLHYWSLVFGCIGVFFAAPVFFSPCDVTVLPSATHACTPTENWLNIGWAILMIAYHGTIILIGLAPKLGVALDSRALLLLLAPNAVVWGAGSLVWSSLVPWDQTGDTMIKDHSYMLAWPAAGIVAFIMCALAHKDGTAGAGMV